MFTYMYIHTYIHIHAYIYIYAHIIYAYISVLMNIYIIMNVISQSEKLWGELIVALLNLKGDCKKDEER